MNLIVQATCAGYTGGLTAEARAALAADVGISEEVLLRYERAVHAHHSVIFPEQLGHAKLIAKLRMWKRGQRAEGIEFAGEVQKALHQIQEEAADDGITREFNEASDALMAAIDASQETKS